MSVRAHRAIIRYDLEETFNLWHDRAFMELLEEAGCLRTLNDGGGYLEISEESLAQIEERFRAIESELSDEDRETTREILERVRKHVKDGDGFARYWCF
jgi:hypothetical protein